jgi:hypothetical protein
MINVLQEGNKKRFYVRHVDLQTYIEFEGGKEGPIKHNKIRPFFYNELLEDLDTAIKLLNLVKTQIEKEIIDNHC